MGMLSLEPAEGLDVSNLIPSVYVIHLTNKEGKTIETKRIVLLRMLTHHHFVVAGKKMF
jgi:hypothetical protein